MTGLLELCEQHFGSKDLYAVLAVKKEATANELRKGYHKKSLIVHPDRADKDKKEEATIQFQTLGRVYRLLSDKDLRQVYDETDDVEEHWSEDNKDWDKYWRGLFTKITIQDLVNFEKEYVGSAEELNDLEEAYVGGKGSMDYILNNVMVCTIEDEDRFRAIIDGWIEDGIVEEYDGYVHETDKKKKQRKRKAAKEAEEAKEAKQAMGLGDSDADLAALIMARQENRKAQSDSFLDSLAAKYTKPNSAKKTKKTKK